MKWDMCRWPTLEQSSSSRSSPNEQRRPPSSSPRICPFPNGPRSCPTLVCARRCWTASLIGRTSSKPAPTASASADPSRKVDPRPRADRCPRCTPGFRYAPARSTAHLHPLPCPASCHRWARVNCHKRAKITCQTHLCQSRRHNGEAALSKAGCGGGRHTIAAGLRQTTNGVHRSGTQSHQQSSRTNQSESLLLLDGAVGDRPEDVRIKPSITRQLLSIDLIALPVAVRDRPQLADVRHDDFVS